MKRQAGRFSGCGLHRVERGSSAGEGIFIRHGMAAGEVLESCGERRWRLRCDHNSGDIAVRQRRQLAPHRLQHGIGCLPHSDDAEVLQIVEWNRFIIDGQKSISRGNTARHCALDAAVGERLLEDFSRCVG